MMNFSMTMDTVTKLNTLVADLDSVLLDASVLGVTLHVSDSDGDLHVVTRQGRGWIVDPPTF